MTYKSYILRYLAFFMAVVIFSTTIGIGLDYHYCKDEVKSVGFFHKAQDCYQLAGYETPEKHADHQNAQGTFIKQKECCNNESVFIQMETDFSLPSLFDFQFDKEFYVYHQANSISNDEIEYYYSPNLYKYYKPPLLEKDHIVLIQSYLL